MQCQNCLTLVIIPNQLATECDLRFLKLDCDPVLSDLNLTASKMASDGAPCGGVLGDIYEDNFVDNLMPSAQIKANTYLFSKRI